MGDDLKKVHPGDPLAGLPAGAYNAFVDAARAHQARQGDEGAGTPAPPRESGVVLVKNNSGADVARYGVLGIDGVLISPTDNEGEFCERPCLEGITPATAAHRGHFVILAEPIPKDKLGRAWLTGHCVARIWMRQAVTLHPYADVKDGDSGHLESAEEGRAEILWVESGGGATKWALVRLAAQEPALVQHGKITNLYQSDGSAWTASNGYPVWAKVNRCDADGGNPDTSYTVLVGLPPKATRTLAIGDPVHYVAQHGDEVAYDSEYVRGRVVGGVAEDDDLPILSSALIDNITLPWKKEDAGHQPIAPDTVFGYTTGWEIDADFEARVPVGYKSGDGDFGAMGHAGGAKEHTHTGTTTQSNNPAFEPDTGDLTACRDAHAHNFTTDSANGLPPYRVMSFIVWKGLS